MIKYPDYHQSILNVSATILKHYQADTIYSSIKVLDDALKLNKKHIVLMLLDGMGINILEKHLPETAILRKYYKQTITSVFPPTTVAATNAVLAAKAPYATGYLGWVQYFKKEDSNCVVFLNQDFYNPNKVFNKVLRDEYLSYETIYKQIEKAQPDVKTYELFPSFREGGYDSFKDQIDRLTEIAKKEERNFTYVYWTDPDKTEHDYGIDSIQTKACLINLNLEIERFSETVNDDTLLIVIADHGLVDVKGLDLYQDKFIQSVLKRQPSMEPRATNFFIKKGYKKDFYGYFIKTYGQYFELYSKKELLKSGLLGYGKKHPLLDDFIGDYVAISISEYMFNSKDHSPFKGHHAGLTKGEMEVPLIIFHK